MSEHIAETLRPFRQTNFRVRGTYEAILSEFIYYESDPRHMESDDIEPMHKLIECTTKAEKEQSFSIGSKKRYNFIQELQQHPEQLKWISDIVLLNERRIFTGNVRLRKVLLGAKIAFDLNLNGGTLNDRARSTLEMIRELVCYVVDLKHWMNHIKIQFARLEPLKFLS